MPAHPDLDIEALVQRAIDERMRLLRRRLAAVASIAVAGAVAFLWGAPALAASCAQTLPSPLVTLCPSSPALAADVNGNVQQLLNWLTQKVGTQGSPNVSVTGSLTVSGATTLPATTATSLVVNTNVGIQGSSHTAGNEIIDGTLTVSTSGGNVMRSCITRTGPANSYIAPCVGSEVAVGGGGRCNSLWRLTESMPWAGPNDGDGPASNGAAARSWRSVCQVWGNAGTYTPPQLGTFVICCQE